MIGAGGNDLPSALKTPDERQNENLEDIMSSNVLTDFSIIRSGFFYRLQLYLKLINENDRRVAARAVIFAAIAWLPLVLFSGIQGQAIHDDPHRSLLLDYSVYGRLLIAVPLFVIAENVVDDRYVIITSYFSNSGIVTDRERYAFLDIFSFIRKLIDSVWAELTLLLLAYIISFLSFFYSITNNPGSWRTTVTGDVSLAGWWALLVGLPLFQFLLYRWIWRLFIWCVFLWRLSHLDLRLISTHPDSAGGLGILAESIYAFTPTIFALSAALASEWGRRVIHGGIAVTEFHRPLIIFLIIMVLIPVVPLMIFTGRLVRLKLHGLHDYGVLANKHSLMFDEKWIRQMEDNIPEVLGAPDISSLADLGGSFQTIRQVKFVPFTVRHLAVIVIAAGIPMIPLILIEVPFKEIIIKVAGALL